jgi:hypothetical protein
MKIAARNLEAIQIGLKSKMAILWNTQQTIMIKFQ